MNSQGDKITNQYQPVIGILTQPRNGFNQESDNTIQFVSSSYVKWLQSSGAKVIPIAYDLPEEQIDFLLTKINGILFPGGGASLWEDEETFSGFSDMQLTGQLILKKVIKANQNGNYFPLWGTCLGLEVMVLALTDKPDALDRLSSNNHVLQTQIVSKMKSKIYKSFNLKDIQSIEQEKAMYYNHHYGFSTESFNSSKIINEFFELTATATDDRGTPFAATLESKKYPIYATQFHPEKNAFEWLDSVVANHSMNAINAARAFADFFVNEARKNTNAFARNEIKNYNIENYPLKAVHFGSVSMFINEGQKSASQKNPKQAKY